MTVKVKICGVTSVADANAAVEFGADAIGLNFFPPSPRAVTIDQAQRITRELPSSTCVIGVFVNADRDHVSKVVEAVGLTGLQFHGDEAPGDCIGWGTLIVIKALPADDPEKLAQRAAEYSTRYVLVDTPSVARGGSGRTFDWTALSKLSLDRLILAGGLTPENVADAVRTVAPLGVDVTSGVESNKGRKDHGKLKAFIDAAKST